MSLENLIYAQACSSRICLNGVVGWCEGAG